MPLGFMHHPCLCTSTCFVPLLLSGPLCGIPISLLFPLRTRIADVAPLAGTRRPLGATRRQFAGERWRLEGNRWRVEGKRWRLAGD